MSYPNPAMNVLSDYMRYEEANEIAQSPVNFQSIDASAFDQEIDIANNTKKMYQEMESGGHTLVKEEPFRLPGMKAVDRFVGNVGIDIANNVMNTVMDVEDFLRDKGLDIPFFRVEEGGIRYAPASERRADLARAKEQGLPRPNFNFQNMEGAGAIEQAVQPMASFIGTMLLTPGGLIPKTASAAFTMDPELGNLSTFLKELGINNEVIDFLDSKVDAQADAEQRLIARVKNLAEEGIISGALEATLVPSLVVAKQLMQQFGGQRLPDLAANAQARIDERSASSTLYSGVDPTPLIDEAIVAANKVIGNKQVDSVPQPKIDPQDNIARIEAPTDNEPGIIAFHGSGADFDEFSLDKIGTGEGSQVFGHGLYFTDTEGIAKFYKDAMRQERNFLHLDGKMLDSVYTADNEEKFIDYLNNNFSGSNYDDALVVLDNLGQGIGSINDANLVAESSFSPKQTEIYKQIRKDLYVPDLPEGSMYKVALSPKPEELLDFDNLLKDQPKTTQSKIQKIIDILPFNKPSINSETGSTFQAEVVSQVESSIKNIVTYRIMVMNGKMSENVFNKKMQQNPFESLVYKKIFTQGQNQGLGVDPQSKSPKIASQIMNEFGIKGIKYLDNSTRNTFGGKLLDVNEVNNGLFQARIVLDNPNRQTGIGGSGKVITKSKLYKTQKEAENWAKKQIENKSSNYVIFDDAAVNILAKYGIVGPVAVTALSKPEPTKNEQ